MIVMASVLATIPGPGCLVSLPMGLADTWSSGLMHLMQADKVPGPCGD